MKLLKPTALGLLAASLPFCSIAQVLPVDGPPPPMPEETYHMYPDGIEVTPYVTGLEAIWDIVFLPDGAALVSERPGRIRYVSAAGDLQEDPWVEPALVVGEENGGGMMGLALHPDFASNGWVYAMYSTDVNGGRVSRVSRFKHDATYGGNEEVILDLLPAGNTHFGGRIDFGPDGMLYVTIGDTGQRGSSQSLADYRAKLLRVTPEGDVPEGNPFPGSPVWAYGLRNTAGLAFRPGTNQLFGADHGPSGEWREPLIGARDELNIIEAGKNYGWPGYLGAPSVEGIEDPILMWKDSPMPPGDIIFYDHDLMPELRGDLFMATLRTEALLRVRFEDEAQPDLPTTLERWFTSEDIGDAPMGEGPSQFGRLRAVAVGPDGAIYIGTTNRDRGRGTLRDGDDRVIRIAPKGM